MIIVTGRTFDQRDKLIRMGGRWNNADRRWQFDHLSERDLDQLRKTVGIVVTEVDETDEFEGDDIDPRVAAALTSIIGKPSTNTKPSAIYGDDPTWHNRFKDQNASAFFGFSSVGKFADYIASLPVSHATDDRRAGWDQSSGPGGFYGTSDMPTALDLARNGWLEGVERAQPLIERLSLVNPRVRRRSASLAGGSVNVGRMLAGDPRHMIRRPRLPGRKTVTFIVEIGVQASIKAENMVIRAALIGAIVDIMESVGYSCAIVATDTSLDNSQRAAYQLAVNVKEQGERLNLTDVIFALGHPSFLRRMSFATCSSADEARHIWASMGSATNAFTTDHPCERGEYYVPTLTSAMQQRLTNDPLSMLPFVTPVGLPITLERE